MNEASAVKKLLETTDTFASGLLFDPQGNTPLHAAVFNHSYDAAATLLAAGVSPEVKNSRNWTPLDEAIALKDHAMVKLLLQQLRLQVKQERKSRKTRLVKILQEIPDFSLQLQWQLGSPLFGLLLKRYAPSDTYVLYKKGLKLRLEGTLRGRDPTSKSLLPKWKRGAFSLFVDASTTPTQMVLVDHTDRTQVDLYAERKAVVQDIDQDVRDLFELGAIKVKVKARTIQFSPKKSWLSGHPLTEKIEGRPTEVFECVGRLVAVVSQKAPVVLEKTRTTFEDYLSMRMPEIESFEVPWDPLKGPPSSVTDELLKNSSSSVEDVEVGVELQRKAEESENEKVESSGGGKPETAREVTGCVWMATNFPLSLRQLLPLLEAVGAANKHIAAAAGFIAQKNSGSMFPVKFKVPLMWTVYIQMKFINYKELEGAAVSDPGFFEVPPGLKRVALQGEQDAAKEEPQNEKFYEAEE